jgi:endonuclease-3 related protein
MVDDNASYDEIMRFFRHNLEKDVFLYQEYHALIVEHGKRYFSKLDFPH